MRAVRAPLGVLAVVASALLSAGVLEPDASREARPHVHPVVRERASRSSEIVVAAGSPVLATSAAAGADEDERLPRPLWWTPILARRPAQGGSSVAVFEASSTADGARDELTRHLEAAGYRMGPIVANDVRGYARDDRQIVASFAPVGSQRTRISVALLVER